MQLHVLRHDRGDGRRVPRQTRTRSRWDDRRPRVRRRAHGPDVRGGRAQPRRAVHRRDRPDARHARPRAHALRLRHLLPRGRRHRRSRRSTSSSSAARRTTTSSSARTGGSTRSARSADFYLRAQWPDGDIDYREYRTRITLEGDKLPGTRQETDTISRLVYGFATAYLLTGEDRFLEAAEKGTEYLRDHMRTVDAAEGIAYWVHGIDTLGRQGEEDPRLRVRRRLRRDPGLRADLRAGRPDADVPRSPATRASCNDIEHDARAVQPLLPRPRGRRLLLAHRPDHVRPAGRRRSAHNQCAQELELGRRPRAGVPDQRVPRDRRRAVRRLPRSYTADTIVDRFPDYDKSPFVNERFHEDWTPDHAWGWQHNRAVVGHNLKIAWNLMRINSVRPNNKYVELAEKIAEMMPTVGSDRQRGGWYDVMEREKRPGPGLVPLHLARPEGVVAAGAGDPRLPDPHAASSATTEYRKRGARRRGVLQRLVPRPRLGRRLLQRARERHAVPARHRAAQGQPLDVGVPHHRALLPGGGLHEPADHEAAARPALQAARGRVRKDRILRVSPDILPPGSITIEQVWIDGQPWTDFDADKLTVNAAAAGGGLTVKVRVVSALETFESEVQVSDGTASIMLTGHARRDGGGDARARPRAARSRAARSASSSMPSGSSRCRARAPGRCSSCGRSCRSRASTSSSSARSRRCRRPAALVDAERAVVHHSSTTSRSWRRRAHNEPVAGERSALPGG